MANVERVGSLRRKRIKKLKKLKSKKRKEITPRQK